MKTTTTVFPCPHCERLVRVKSVEKEEYKHLDNKGVLLYIQKVEE